MTPELRFLERFPEIEILEILEILEAGGSGDHLRMRAGSTLVYI